MSNETVYDLCIVGAGMFGSAAARHASVNPLLKVCLVGTAEPTLEERPKREIFASHYDEGRIVRVLDSQLACQVLTQQSISRYQELERLSGIDFHTPVGCLFMGERNGDFMLSIQQAAGSFKIPYADLSKPEVFQRRYPYLQLKKDEHAILDDNGGGHISPRKLVKAQKKVAEMQGCTIIHGVVNGIKTLTNGVHEVHTEKGAKIKAKRLLISTGAFVNMKELEPLKPMAVHRHKETLVLLKIPDDEVKRLSSLPDMIILRKGKTPKDEIGCYILPPIKYPDGKYYIKIGDLLSHDNSCDSLKDMTEHFLSDGDEKIIATHLPLATDLVPGLKYESISKLTCVTCHTPSGYPYIDRVSPTVTVAVGGNARGAKFSDEIGRIAAHLSLTGKWDSELSQNHFRAIFQ